MAKRKKNPMTKDHIVPRELGGSDDPINIRIYPERKHTGRHAYFGNKLITQEIAQLLDEGASAITSDFAMEMKRVMFQLLQEGLVYKDGVWR